MDPSWKNKLSVQDVRWNEPLAKHTYYRIGGPADALVIPQGLGELASLSQLIHQEKIPFFILGMGSNLLVSDQGFRGLVVKCSRLDLSVSQEPSGRVRAGASVAVSTFLRKAGEQGWDGLEFLAGVPGSVGGVVAMNAGTHMGEAKDRLVECDVFSLSDGKTTTHSLSEAQFDYRRNLFLSPSDVVLSAVFRVDAAPPDQVRAKIQEVLDRRKATQPVEYPSCGSVFMNPVSSGLKSWEVIDRLGLRGHRIGGAMFSEKHCNFIVNLGGARAADVRALIDLAKTRARAELGIELNEEVKYLGF